VGANSPPAAAFFVCLVVSFGIVTGLRIVLGRVTEVTLAAAAARTTSYWSYEAGEGDVGECFVGNGGEQGAVGCLLTCLALLSALVFDHLALFHHEKLCPGRSLSLDLFFVIERANRSRAAEFQSALLPSISLRILHAERRKQNPRRNALYARRSAHKIKQLSINPLLSGCHKLEA
jgi:hypothetical protein